MSSEQLISSLGIINSVMKSFSSNIFKIYGYQQFESGICLKSEWASDLIDQV